LADQFIGGGLCVRRFAGPASFGGALEHLRVVHLTDLHVGRVTPLEVQLEAARITNSLKPDLIAITGDFVCHSQLHLHALTEVVRSLSAPVFCVLGNHDYWSGAEGVREALRRGGAEILDNAHTRIALRGQTLQLVGLDDAYTGHADLARATRGLSPKLPTIGLSHIAEEADGLWNAGARLVLSGHTHAGQVTLARLNELALGRLVGHRYVHGLYGSREGDSAGAVYVSAGIGAAVVPFRIGERARREIALFELGALPGSFAEHHPEQRPLLGRPPSPRRQYLRAAAVVHKERKRARRRG
jgi:predicted MPP superfamily phosphohydrolase